MVSVKKRSWTTNGVKRQGYRVRYVDDKEVQRQRTFPTLREANDFRDELVGALGDGTHVPDAESLTVAEAAENWLAACKVGREGRPPLEASTMRAYTAHVERFIKPKLGKRWLNDLRKPMMVKFRDELLLDGNSPGMVKRVMGAMSNMLKWCSHRGEIANNVAYGVTVATSKRHAAEEEPFILPPKDVVREMLSAADRWCAKPPGVVIRGKMTSMERITVERAIWWRAILAVLVGAGTRVSEALGMPIDGLIRQKQQLEIKQRADEFGKIGLPKSAAGFRKIPVDAAVFGFIDEWLAVRPKILGEGMKSDLLFCNGPGKAELYRNLHRRFWTPLLIEVGAARQVTGADGKERVDADFGIHALRHFHASLCIAAGMEAKTLQARMGHSSIQVTMDIYGHLFEDHEAESVRLEQATRATGGLFGSTNGQGMGKKAIPGGQDIDNI
ncbi:tyrosine-type recombinase/integrase [Terrarubrum flagellatum]|uniref:tyrosine-type recombinase/integrase n=1 Tax=Terrirubrum flagellatum TaxID=2895980 RepID=UPI00314570DF